MPLWRRFNAVDSSGCRLRRAARQYHRASRRTAQFFGGGPDNVRGFRESRLGPKDQFGNPYGGNLRIMSQNELIFPMPAKWAQTARVSAFFDMGNVFQTGSKLKFYGPDGVTPEDYRFSFRTSSARSAWRCSGWRPWVCSGSASACR